MNNEKKDIELNKPQKDGLNYSGIVTIKIMDGDREISSRVYHNSGTRNLFEFLSHCLQGRISEAESYRPCRVVLFKQDDREDTASIPAGTYSSGCWSEENRASIPIFYDNAPIFREIVNETSGQVIGSSATFHFRIPYLYITSGVDIVKVGLFPNLVTYPEKAGNTKHDFGSMCAYHFLLTEDGEKFAPIAIPDPSPGNFTVIID